MLAFGLVLVIFCFWSFVGFAVVSALFTRRNLLQGALLAPVTGLGATVLLVTALNWIAPVRVVGPISTVLILALAGWLLQSSRKTVAVSTAPPQESASFFPVWRRASAPFALLRRRRAPVPFSRLAPFGAVVLLAALAVGFPMFWFGFNWISYGNDDMSNYCLSAQFLLNHNQFTPPSLQAILGHQNASLFFWNFDVLRPIRHGADELLAWVLSLTGLASQQAFMPVIVVFQLVLITATGALVLQSKRYRRAALMVCFWLAFSALIALGSVYQLFGQVGGLAALAGAATVLLRRPGARPRSELVLGGLLLASLSMIYPEVLPFLIIGYGVFQAISVVKGCERIQDVAVTIWPIAAVWLVLVNVSLAVPILTLLNQSRAGMSTATGSSLFPFYMTPAAFAYLWGFRAISEAPVGIGLDIGIVAGALVFGIAVCGANGTHGKDGLLPSYVWS